jgi:hypothetical protein
VTKPSSLVSQLCVVVFFVSFLPSQSMGQTIFDGWRELPGGAITRVRDAAIVYHGKLYLFGIGMGDGGHYLNVFDAAQWSGWRLVPGGGTTALPDAATVYRDKLYLFAIGARDHAHYGNVFDGTDWSGWRGLPGGATTSLPDAATVYGDKLYLFGIGSGDHAHYVNVFDGLQWSGWRVLGGTTAVAAAATVFNGKLYLFGIGTGDHSHYMNIFDGVQWSDWIIVPGGGTTLLSDAATVYGDKLYLFGIGSGDHAHYVNVFDGAQWSGWKPVQGGGTTAMPDTVVAYGNKLYLFGIGASDQKHYVNTAGTTIKVQSPRYNDVLQKATHNSYWVNVDSADAFASGVQERIVDQMLHEAVRSFELDLHYESGHSGEFTVYHTSAAQSNSMCHYLTDCLDLIKRLDYLEPNHEVVTINLEFKEALAASRVFGNNNVIGSLKHNHHIEDLDRQLWERLGTRLYTPGEFLARCPAGSTLRECAGLAGWPTLDELRGRYIVTVLGNWSDNYWDWLEYANDLGGAAARAAFPMRSMLTTSPTSLAHSDTRVPGWLQAHADYQPWIELNGASLKSNADHPYIFSQLDDATFKQRLRNARDASVFWQVEDERFKDGDVPGKLMNGQPGFNPNGLLTFLDTEKANGNRFGNGVVRIGDNGGSRFQPTNQLTTIIATTYQQYQTDFPWNTIFSRKPLSTVSLSVPEQPFFERAQILKNSVRHQFDPNALREPGARLYFSHDDPLNPVDASITSSADTDWQVQPSTTTVTHDGVLQPQAQPGSLGCLFARAPRSGDQVEVCRKTLGSSNRAVQIIVSVTEAGVVRQTTYTVPHQEPNYRDVGDLLKMQVVSGGRVVRLWTSGTMGPDGTPRWNRLPIGDLSFRWPLTTQGLRALGDVLFVGPRFNGQLVTRSFFPSITVERLVQDLSWCIDGACIQAYRPDHIDLSTDRSGAAYVGVHESEGRVFGQWRTLLTTDRFEVTNSGLYQFQTFNKFLLLRDDPKAGEPMTALYGCVDWRRDYHQHWVSTDPSCTNANTKDPYAENEGRIGYIATTQLPGTLPLWHTRKGTQNDGSADTHDHYFAVGDSQRNVKIQNEGYELVGNAPVGWVYTKGKLP